MNACDHESAAERWLDDALKDYSNIRCRMGLENRILVTLAARAAQRQRKWILALAVSAALVIAAGVMTSLRQARGGVPAQAVVRKPSREFVSSVANAAAHSATGESAKLIGHATIQGAGARTRPLSEQLLFGKKKGDLAPVHDQEAEPFIALQTTAPEVSIQDLGVQPIQIKELAPIRDMN